MKKLLFSFLALMGLVMTGCSDDSIRMVRLDKRYAHKVDSVLRLMTLEEKIGQMNQYTGDYLATGPMVKDSNKIAQIKAGKVGSMLNIIGAADTRTMQEYAMQSRLGIPLVFGLDVIYGLRTVYPIPLAEAASFDLDLMRRTAAGSAWEASAQGIHWTFAPMVDIARDARWGRVMEGAGEDTWYGSKVAEARVRGFQGNDLSAVNTVMACAKHFAAYGACIAGKDYNTVDISELTLVDTYLPPFKAAAEAGVSTFMNGFNELNGVPVTGNAHLQRDILKGDWGYNGFSVSDWRSVDELVPHGYAADLKDAARLAALAGCDMDMESRAYATHLQELVEDGAVPERFIDDAVRRILQKKFELGLFDDPFRYCDEEREKDVVCCDSLMRLSREAGSKSIVLLKNENQVLPLNHFKGKIALVGAMADSRWDMLGAWANEGCHDRIVTIKEGLCNKFGASNVLFAEGYDLETNELKLEGALKVARQAEVVIVAVGERRSNTGEARSKSDITIPASHQELVKVLKSTGKKVIVLLTGGRPMIFNEMEPYSDAIVLTWLLGTQAGNAIADVLAGDYNPSAKLPMTFPAHLGQVPIYYNYKNTGRPHRKGVAYTCGYQDIDYDPAYPFGFGLSYTEFEIGVPELSRTSWKREETVEVAVKVRNVGKYAGKETVQLYIRDLVGSVTRPVKELRGFQQVYLDPGEEKTVSFRLGAEELGFYNADLQFVVEPGRFQVMAGGNSRDVKTAEFDLL